MLTPPDAAVFYIDKPRPNGVIRPLAVSPLVELKLRGKNERVDR